MSSKIAFALPDEYIRKHPSSTKGSESLWFVFQGTKLLLHKETRLLPVALKPSSHLYLGTLLEKEVFTTREEPSLNDFDWYELRSLHGQIDDALFALAGRALQLLEWEKTHKFCGCCGAKTTAHKSELCFECPTCQHLFYPRLSPVIMVQITRENKILLARSPHFPPEMYSILAGFVESGETLEQCVHREVFEEVGLRIDNIRYFASQSWPFPHSLMIAFTANWVSGDITIDPIEIEDAQWFELDKLPQLPPPFSLARQVIDSI